MESRTAHLDRDVLMQAAMRWGVRLLGVLGALVLMVVLVLGVLSDELPLLASVPLMLLSVLGIALVGRTLALMLLDRYDALARQYLVLVGEHEIASSPVRRRPWRDAIEAALKR